MYFRFVSLLKTSLLLIHFGLWPKTVLLYSWQADITTDLVGFHAHLCWSFYPAVSSCGPVNCVASPGKPLRVGSRTVQVSVGCWQPFLAKRKAWTGRLCIHVG